MFTVSRTIIAQPLFIASLLLSSLARADVTDTCFNFLSVQDYARAESEAKQLLQQGNLDRTDERATQLCLERAYSKMGRTQDALTASQRVEALSQTTEELGLAYARLGSNYATLQDLDRAELYDQRALKACRKLGDKKGEAIMLNNLASLASRRGDTERALKLFRETLAMLPKAEQSTTLNNIATIHSIRKEYKPAIKLLRQAIEIAHGNGDAHRAAIYQINLGDVLKNDKQYASAEKELLSGLNAIRLVGDKRWEADACEKLGWLTEIDGNPKKNATEAQQWRGKAEELYREIGDTKNADRLAAKLEMK